jgi:hypothetical protein
LTPAQVDDEDHCVLDCRATPIVGVRAGVVAAVRQAWPEAPLNSFKSFCAAIEELHKRGAHDAKHKCVLFVAHCFKQAHTCWKDPDGYDVDTGDAWGGGGFQYDSFSSDSELPAGDLEEAGEVVGPHEEDQQH